MAVNPRLHYWYLTLLEILAVPLAVLWVPMLHRRQKVFVRVSLIHELGEQVITCGAKSE